MTSRDGHNSEMYHPGLVDVLRHAWAASRGSLSLIIVTVCTVFFLAVAGLNLSGLCSRQQTVSFLGLSYVGIFKHVWLHQFVTAPLLHGGIVHLLFNMLALWMLGPQVEKQLGRGRYAVFSAVCAAASMLGSLLLNWGTGTIVLGYSGVIFGILVAQAVFFPDSVMSLFAFFPVRMKYGVLILGAAELYLTVSPEGAGIAHAAHLCGAVAAAAFLVMMRFWDKRGAMAIARPESVVKRKPRRIVTCGEIPREL